VFIRHPERQLKRCYSEPQLKEYHVLNPYLEPQLKGYVPSHNSRNTSKPTFKASLKHCRLCTSRVRNINTTVVPPGGSCNSGVAPGGKLSAARRFLLFQEPSTSSCTCELQPVPTILILIGITTQWLHSCV